MNPSRVSSKPSLSSWDITTVQELGWSAIKNGELLARADAQSFIILITADRNLRYQQSAPRQLAILVLPTNRARVIRTLLPDITTALTHLRPGDLVELPLPSTSA
jgi:hypothetical protein